MKRFFFLFTLLWGSLFAQGLEFVTLYTEAIGEKVQLTWEVAAGNQCQNVELQHSIDGVSFSTFFTYAGICGDPNVTLSYNEAHGQPILNHANYYRVKVNQDLSHVRRVFVNSNNELNIQRNRDHSYEILFNSSGDPFTVSIFSINGHLLYTRSYEGQAAPVYLPEVSGLHKVLILEQSGRVLAKKY
ncbi:MAG: hypothetical protein N4A46_02855 [Schleiferiaceae bacterium]|jgi:hypothetical protein|nr:hypothetical protein [Schleiferiaceae bacterium]